MNSVSRKFQIEYKKLNKKQKEAVDAIEGPVLVIAGPGSGKTQVLTMRAGNILLKTDTRPGNILCLTFTDSAAANMKKRLSDLIGKDGYRVGISTFHSFGVDIIERYPEYFYGGASFYPADELVQLEVIENILKDLRYDDPLGKTHPEQGYIYLKDVKNAIQKIKKGGLTADEFEEILAYNSKEIEKYNPEIDAVFGERMTKGSIEKSAELLEKMKNAKEDSFPAPYFGSLKDALVKSLGRAVGQAQEEGKQTPLSTWKKAHTRKSEDGKQVLKETSVSPKLHSLSQVYKKYTEKMYELGYYDFEDMLLDVIQAMKKYPELQYELWEQYQYILVDEFQDTNDAQMRLLYLLTEAEVSEGRPNICAVGDDDQAIYKFQGALLSNILDFRSHFREPKLVALTENYRSTQDILDLAQFFIRKGEDRLEKLIPELEKTLVASNKSLEKGDILTKSFPTDLQEYTWVASEIQRLIDEGSEPSSIAVISRNHKQLEEFSRYLNAYSIPTFYERKQNVFDELHVRQLVQMARFVVTLSRKNTDEADELLPEILSYPFWGLSRRQVWDIATKAERGRREGRDRWIDMMLRHEDTHIREIAEFFLEVADYSKSHTLLETLDLLIGEHVTFESPSQIPES
jgi:DNA helicase-2/ATP-dependent DNA helicase PcrA